MSKPQNISSYEELEERKRELELEVEVSQRELAHSLGTSRVNLNDFIMKKIALPIGGAVAAVWLIGKMRGSKPRHTHEYHEKTIIKEVPSKKKKKKQKDWRDEAVNHYPVPPPRPRDDEDDSEPRFIAQRPKTTFAASANRPAPAVSTKAQSGPLTEVNKDGEAQLRSEPKEGEALAPKQKKHLINMATIASVAKIAVPAIKMIVKAVNDHKAKVSSGDTDSSFAQSMVDKVTGGGDETGAAAAQGQPSVAVGHS